MTRNLLSASLLGVALSVTMTAAHAANPPLADLVALCQKNARCSNETTSDGTLFRMRLSSRTHNILCQEDGVCVALLPRGQRYSIDNAAARMTAQ